MARTHEETRMLGKGTWLLLWLIREVTESDTHRALDLWY